MNNCGLLSVWTRGDRSLGPHVLITGGVHGDEFEPMAAARRLIEELSRCELRGQVTIVPVVNEPAFRLGQRAADDGKDLARTCPGRVDGTITERIAHELSGLIRSAEAYIDLHTGGTRFQVSPLAGYVLHPDPEILDQQRRMARLFGLPINWGTEPGLQGRSLSVARDSGVPAIYTEYMGGGGCDPQGVTAYVRGCLNVLADWKVIDEAFSIPLVKPLVVEDPRPNSGHMQINHPSPLDGFFEPSVRLGQKIQQGEPLGTVSDVLGTQAVTVPAAHSGIVLVLHTFSHVAEGDSLGVILETGV